jgi:hypothetical protein
MGGLVQSYTDADADTVMDGLDIDREDSKEKDAVRPPHTNH